MTQQFSETETLVDEFEQLLKSTYFWPLRTLASSTTLGGVLRPSLHMTPKALKGFRGPVSARLISVSSFCEYGALFKRSF